jgi:hypothetical protein
MSKNVLFKTPLFSSAQGNSVMTGTSVLTSPNINIKFLDNEGVQLHFTGTPTGTFQVQVSNDHDESDAGNVIAVGNWVSVVLNPAPVAAGALGDIYIDLNQLSAMWIRVVYTNSSGVGVLTGFIAAKAVGG